MSYHQFLLFPKNVGKQPAQPTYFTTLKAIQPSI